MGCHTCEQHVTEHGYLKAPLIPEYFLASQSSSNWMWSNWHPVGFLSLWSSDPISLAVQLAIGFIFLEAESQRCLADSFI